MPEKQLQFLWTEYLRVLARQVSREPISPSLQRTRKDPADEMPDEEPAPPSLHALVNRPQGVPPFAWKISTKPVVDGEFEFASPHLPPLLLGGSRRQVPVKGDDSSIVLLAGQLHRILSRRRWRVQAPIALTYRHVFDD